MKTIYLSSIILLTGCENKYFFAHPEALENIQLGMTKKEVTETVLWDVSGKRRCGYIDENQNQIEVYEYMLWKPFTAPEKYWLIFKDGNLVQWGQAGDLDTSYLVKYKIDVDINK